MSGIAFEFGDTKYTFPNRSMSSFAEGITKFGRDCGVRKEFQGFWLDILVGPYIAFGVKPDEANKDLFQIMNKGTGAECHRHHVVEVALHNMLGFMFEIEVS